VLTDSQFAQCLALNESTEFKMFMPSMVGYGYFLESPNVQMEMAADFKQSWMKFSVTSRIIKGEISVIIIISQG